MPSIALAKEGPHPAQSYGWQANFNSYRDTDGQGYPYRDSPLRRFKNQTSGVFSAECSSVFRAPGLGPGGRRWKSCHSDQFQIAAVVEYMRHPSSKRNDAGGTAVRDSEHSIWGIQLAGLGKSILPAAPLPGSVKVARRPVRPLVLVRVQVWQPISGCTVSSRRPCSERGGHRCNSCHPDHFGWLAEQQCPGPENRVSLRAAWVRFLHHPPISHTSCSSKAEHPADNRKTQERYLLGRPFPRVAEAD